MLRARWACGQLELIRATPLLKIEVGAPLARRRYSLVLTSPGLALANSTRNGLTNGRESRPPSPWPGSRPRGRLCREKPGQREGGGDLRSRAPTRSPGWAPSNAVRRRAGTAARRPRRCVRGRPRRSGRGRDEPGERLGFAPDAQHELACVRDDPTRDREEREAHPLRPRRLHRGWQRQPLHRRQHVVRQQAQAVPRGIGAEAPAGRHRPRRSRSWSRRARARSCRPSASASAPAPLACGRDGC